ncbi:MULTISPECIES: IclR family transcriptional regulator [Cupriavidus]|uniref:IclR family transcriptional regulator n=1 Tax=Cupriavidus campinensis TaxID=151783 RepID=A0ABY3EM59_9BURK|nr:MULTISPECIES: IclR family transcriptional regulator [Cupriavidus]MCM3606144.1 IclR family transcriptional regulator [Cupriavidus pauculus]MDT6961226.1 IclR family transcriptional regulator [Cupriavidus sp. SZY C1]MWL90030.1 helix-turn-helix domain-containing protein [Cupriavidus sp. SW-Y-13]QWE96767.1 IclR family transcriptional regulator [Cupriavidus sp. EM10]TSP12016.1 IclR family transcriptional regulator [Cupriavidus campinensis]
MTAINLPEPSHRPGKQDLAFTPPSPELSFERETPTLRALSLLEFLVAADRPLSPAEILQGFDAPKASLHRMLSALVAGGLVVREPGPRNIYTVGPRLARLGLAIVTRSGPKQLRHAVLTKLVEDIGETVNVTVLHESSILYLDRIEAPWPLRLDLQPGSRVPLHCSASGKLLLSALPRNQRTALMQQLRLDRFTANTITDMGRLEAELERCVEQQIGVDDEEFIAGISCVAVPIYDADGQVLAALAVHAPAVRSPLSRSLSLVPRLQRAAAELANTF